MLNSKVKQYLEGFKKGSIETFENFYEQYSAFVYSTALKILKNSYDAEDICHNVFLEIFKHPTSYNPAKGSLKAYLAVKTKSRCLDLIRSKQLLITNELDYNDSKLSYNTDIEKEVLKRLSFKKIINILKNIPKNQQQVILGNYLLGKTHRELARELNRPLGSIKSSIRYGLKNIQHQLAQNGWFKEKG